MGLKDKVIIGFASQINFTRSASRTRIIGFASQINFTRSASRQMEQIRMGLKDKVDASLYADPANNYETMRQIRISDIKNA